MICEWEGGGGMEHGVNGEEYLGEHLKGLVGNACE